MTCKQRQQLSRTTFPCITYCDTPDRTSRLETMSGSNLATWLQMPRELSGRRYHSFNLCRLGHLNFGLNVWSKILYPRSQQLLNRSNVGSEVDPRLPQIRANLATRDAMEPLRWRKQRRQPEVQPPECLEELAEGRFFIGGQTARAHLNKILFWFSVWFPFNICQKEFQKVLTFSCLIGMVVEPSNMKSHDWEPSEHNDPPVHLLESESRGHARRFRLHSTETNAKI